MREEGPDSLLMGMDIISERDKAMNNKYQAPKDYIWVCLACGKYSDNRMGVPGSGWDESCFLNSKLVREDCVKFNDNKTQVVQVWQKVNGK